MEAEEKREVEYLQEYWLEPVGDRYDQQAQADASIKEQYEMEQEEESLKKSSSSEDATRPRCSNVACEECEGWNGKKKQGIGGKARTRQHGMKMPELNDA